MLTASVSWLGNFATPRDRQWQMSQRNAGGLKATTWKLLRDPEPRLDILEMWLKILALTRRH